MGLFFIYLFFLFQTSLEEVNISKMKPRVVELAVSLALDRKASHRELTSVLISDLYGKAINPKDIQMGFDGLLNNLKDLTIDSPEAPKVRTRSSCITFPFGPQFEKAGLKGLRSADAHATETS